MAQEGKQPIVYNFNINASHDFDNHAENVAGTHFVNPTIGQLTLHQGGPNNVAPGGLNNNATGGPSNAAAGGINNAAAGGLNNNATAGINNNATGGSHNAAAGGLNNNATGGPNNAAAGVPINEAVIIHEEDTEMDLCSGPSTSLVRKVSSDHAGFQENFLKEIKKRKLSKKTSSSEAKEEISIDEKGNTFSHASSNNEDRVEKHNSLRCALLRVRASSLCKKNNYLEAGSILEKLTRIQQEDVGVDALLLTAEVSIQLGKKQENEKAIDNILRLPVTSTSDVDDVFCHACDLLVKKSYVRGIVLLRISGGMYKLHSSLSPNDIVRGIRECIKKLDSAIEPMVKSSDKLKFIAVKYSLPYMIKMVDDLRRVENSDSICKSENEAWCLCWIGANYDLVEEYEKSIEFNKSGFDVIERQFGNDALKYKIYGIMSQNIGLGYCKLGRSSIAEVYFQKAIGAFFNATDFANEAIKLDHTLKAQQYLEKVRAVRAVV